MNNFTQLIRLFWNCFYEKTLGDQILKLRCTSLIGLLTRLCKAKFDDLKGWMFPTPVLVIHIHTNTYRGLKIENTNGALQSF